MPKMPVGCTSAGCADTRNTQHHDRLRGNLDDHGVHILATAIASGCAAVLLRRVPTFCKVLQIE